MPLISSPRPSFPQPGSELVAELFTPSTDRFVADHYAAGRHGFFDVPETHREPIVEPNVIRDDLFREAIATVWVVGHSFSISSSNDHQCDNALVTPRPIHWVAVRVEVNESAQLARMFLSQ